METVIYEQVLDTQGKAMFADLIKVSQALGADPELVLHGGGNTSVKLGWQDITGSQIEALLVKGSGHDLATITEAGFTPLRLARLKELLPPTPTAQECLAQELALAKLIVATPAASVETLVHALIPYPAVVHSHADVILQLTNTPDGVALIKQVLGSKVLIVPYATPGVPLAHACVQAWADASSDTEGLVVLNHGLFTFGATPSAALKQHLELVSRAKDYLAAHISVPTPATTPLHIDPLDLARLRKEICMLEGRSVIVRHFGDTKIAGLVARPEYLQATQRGLLTPDHVIYTGRRPLLGHDVAAFAASYSAQNAEFGFESATCSISSPRVLLDPSYGMLCVGRNARTAKITSDLATHMLSSIAISEQLGGYRPADAEHCCELEFWGAQQAKLAKPSLELEGRVALVTGAGSGIGKACAAELLSSGASVIGWDISPKVIDTFNSPEWLGQVVDVTDHEAQAEALQGLVDRFGGLDILVVSAGIFPQATHIKDLNQGDWRRAMAINVDAVADLYTLVYPYLALSYGGGRVVVIASKNVAAPGPGAAAYSSSKAALTQLSRVAALEWAEAGIRVNYLHPDAVFDTGLWTPELLAARAEHYGMTVDQYKRRNLLHTEVTSKAVAKLATAMATDLFACSTGAQVSIDGGNDRSI